jgi:hypothetical protein
LPALSSLRIASNNHERRGVVLVMPRHQDLLGR